MLLTDLPLDVFQLLASNLQLGHLLCLRATCTKLRDLVRLQPFPFSGNCREYPAFGELFSPPVHWTSCDLKRYEMDHPNESFRVDSVRKCEHAEQPWVTCSPRIREKLSSLGRPICFINSSQADVFESMSQATYLRIEFIKDMEVLDIKHRQTHSCHVEHLSIKPMFFALDWASTLASLEGMNLRSLSASHCVVGSECVPYFEKSGGTLESVTVKKLRDASAISYLTRLQSLTINDPNSQWEAPVDSQTLPVSLQSLKCHLSVFSNLPENLSRLKNLREIDTLIKDSPGGCKPHSAMNEKIVGLQLDPTNVKDWAQYMKAKKSLIDGSGALGLTRLKFLKLLWNSHVPELIEALGVVMDGIQRQNVERLTVGHVKEVSSLFLSSQPWNRLTRLHLHSSAFVTNATVWRDSFPCLQHLTLDYKSTIGDRSARQTIAGAIEHKVTSLRRLTLVCAFESLPVHKDTGGFGVIAVSENEANDYVVSTLSKMLQGEHLSIDLHSTQHTARYKNIELTQRLIKQAIERYGWRCTRNYRCSQRSRLTWVFAK